MEVQPVSDLPALATDAYVYGFPLVSDVDEVDRFTRTGMGAMRPAPVNTFSHATQLAGPDDTFVSVNNDTIYSIAMLDLSAGPMIMNVPDTAGRYYVMQFVDAWTNNFAYVGRRATGTAAGRFLLTPPGWTGSVPPGLTRISCPTRAASIVGRWACAGADDLPAVQALQRAVSLQPMGTPAPAVGLPQPDGRADDDLRFFEKMRVRMQAFPPARRDVTYQQTFAQLGLLDAASPYASPDPELAEALRIGMKAGKERIEDRAVCRDSTIQDGWLLAYHAFDYNADFFEIGARSDAEWVIADRAEAYLTRAVAAQVALWGNHAYEAAYAMTFNDGSGKPLDGRRAYTMRLTEPPPVDAFWSVTMYGVPDYYLVANPIDRYSLGDRTPGLHYAADGSLTLHLRPDRPPDAAEAANWLPTPSGPFRPILRMYQPTAAALDGSYVIPPITPVGGDD